jgi:diketogulonate reductase-like aldo/keto reductase
MDNKTLVSTVTLNNSVKMPQFGLGTFQSNKGQETQDAVRWALEFGYRHIDTAAIYHNEEDVGKGIRDSGVLRKDIFLTTKLWDADQAYDAALRAYDQSLKRLGVEYVDLYLIHWPVKGTRADAWRALVRLYQEGRVRAVGVSNYTVRNLQELLADSPVVPAVNQFELSPFNTSPKLVNFCREHGIMVESYSPLARGKKLGDPSVAGLAQRYAKTPAQILIRWALDKGYVVIPKSVHQARIVENANIFDFSLTAHDLQTLDSLNENLHTINPPWMAGEWD